MGNESGTLILEHVKPSQVLRVEFSTIEDTRRLILSQLAKKLPERQRARLAGDITQALRDGGVLAHSLEQHYNAAAIARLLGRSPPWVAARIKAGDFGACSIDDGGWMVPASGVHRYLAERVFSASTSPSQANAECAMA